MKHGKRLLKLDRVPSVRICERGDYNGRAYELDERYEWQIVIDSNGFICLVPMKRAGRKNV